MFFRTVQKSTSKRRRIWFEIEYLEDRIVPATAFTAADFQHFCIFLPKSDGGLVGAGGTPSGYSPLQLRTAYGVNSSTLTGAGQTIAIVDMYNDIGAFYDLDVFDKQFTTQAGGASLYDQYGAASTFLSVFDQNGNPINPASTSVPADRTGDWEAEESLDLQWAHAMAPGAKIDLIECSSDLYAGVRAAAALPGVTVVSMSWGARAGEFADEQNLDSTFTTPSGHPGVTFLASTGDDSFGEYPAFSPNVIAVGGTTLTLTDQNTIASETAWSTGSDQWNPGGGTGGGTSLYENQPSYQSAVQSTGHRTTPDISFDADPATGVAVYDSTPQYNENGTLITSGGWGVIGGTSLAAPAVAGFFAMANQGRVATVLVKGSDGLTGSFVADNTQATLNTSSATEALTELYSLSSSDFHDITNGQISASGHGTYSAGTGYDQVTGRGSPIVNLLVDDLSAHALAPPAAPVFTTTVVSNSQINLAWNAVAGATSYTVAQWINNAWQQIATNISSTSYQVTGLTASTSYYFEVAASNSVGTTWASAQTATTLATAVAAPRFTLTTVSGSEIDLSWNAVTGATNYVVYEWLNNTPQPIYSGSGTSFAVTGLHPNTTYWFQVAAQNAAGAATAAWQSAATLATAVAAPRFTLATVSGSEIDVSWNAVAGATNYVVYEWLNNTPQPIYSGSGTSFAVTGLQPSTTYWFVVAAQNAAGTAAAAWQSAATPAAGPVAPTFTTKVISTSEIDLSWNAVAGAANYIVYEWLNNTVQPIYSGSGTSFAVTGLQPGTTYWFQVAAQNAAGKNVSAWQSAATLMAVAPPAPAFSVTAVSPEEIDLSWNAAATATGYEVDEWIQGRWQSIYAGTATRFAATGLNPNTLYYFQVGATNAYGTTFAYYQSAKTLSILPPSAPIFTLTTISSSEIDVAWSAVATATLGYVVNQWEFVQAENKWDAVPIYTGTATSCKVTGLSANTKYYFEVAARNGGGTTFADWQQATTFQVARPAAPSFAATKITNTEIDLSWDSVSGATGYLLDAWDGSQWVPLYYGASTRFQVTGLTANTLYYFDVGAYNAGGTTWADYQSITTAAPPPPAATFSLTPASQSQIDVSWNSVSGAADYVVDQWEFVQAENKWEAVPIYTGSSTHFSATGLNAGTQYWFTVGARNTSGTTWATWQNVSTWQNAPPPAPTFTLAAVAASQVNITWSAVAQADSYEVDQWDGYRWVDIANTAGTSFAVTGLSASTTYYFQVGAHNNYGTTFASWKSVKTLAGLAAPVFTVTAASSSQINLSWNSVIGATDYVVDQWNGSLGRWDQVYFGSATSFHATGLNASTTYYFIVGAYNPSFNPNTTWAAYQSVTTPSGAPAAPTFTLTPISGTQINVAWNTVAGAASYEVDEWVSGAWYPVYNGTGTSYSATSLMPGGTYYFQVSALNNSGKSTAQWQQATTPVITAPAAPVFSATAVSATQINVAWNTVSGATGYEVEQWEYVQAENKSDWVRIYTGTGTSKQITGLAAGTSYYIRVGAANSAGTTFATYQTVTTPGVNFSVDHPAAKTGYTAVTGTLFGSTGGPVFRDVAQGYLGDCWFLASLAEVAARSPSIISSMFTYEGTTLEDGVSVGVYTVRFYDTYGTARYVTVDTELPSGGNYYDHPQNGVLWVALAEKAYAEANGHGWVTTRIPNSDSYAAMEEGQPAWALHAITGQSASNYAIGSSDIGTAWNQGKFVVLCTGGSTADSRIVAGHAYALVNYNAGNAQPFQIFNPWGTDANGWVPGQVNKIYGLFFANLAFVTQNYATAVLSTGVAVGTIPTLSSLVEALPTTQLASIPAVNAVFSQRGITFLSTLNQAALAFLDDETTSNLVAEADPDDADDDWLAWLESDPALDFLILDEVSARE